MREVAELAGVSSMTVSHVLNGTKRVQDTTRDAVLAAVEQLNYSPNLAAKSLAGAEPARIVVVHANKDSGYLSALLVGSLNAASRRAAQLTVQKLELQPGESPAAALIELAKMGADAFLLAAPLGELADADPALRALNTPMIAHAPGRPLAHMPAVRIDQAGAAAAVTRHLLDLGHRRIGFVSGPTRGSAGRGRLAGYQATLVEAGVAPDDALVIDGGFTFASGMAAGDRLLDLPSPPTAIFAANDAMAAGVIAAAHRRQVAVPADLSVVGFDDEPLAQMIWPALTTVQQPISDMAEAAMAYLVEELGARRSGAAPSEPAERTLPYTLVIRDSAGPPKG